MWSLFRMNVNTFDSDFIVALADLLSDASVNWWCFVIYLFSAASRKNSVTCLWHGAVMWNIAFQLGIVAVCLWRDCLVWILWIYKVKFKSKIWVTNYMQTGSFRIKLNLRLHSSLLIQYIISISDLLTSV